jgi:hypothetical protein
MSQNLDTQKKNKVSFTVASRNNDSAMHMGRGDKMA